MPRKVSVPLTRYTENREDILVQLERFGAQRVFLCTDRGISGDEERKKQIALLKNGVKFFRSKGYEVGIWLSSLGHGGSLSGVPAENKPGFTKIIGVTGASSEDSFCPADDSFIFSFCSWIAMLATAEPDIIMIDDDFRLGTRSGGFGCFCEKHMKLYEERVGESLSREDMLQKMYCGAPNKYRDAHLDISGETLKNFAHKVREAVDSVNPKIRAGACSCFSVWDFDGVDSIEISQILAGTTKPFMRFIGAPYWAKSSSPFGAFCGKLAYIIELERMQAYWCNNSNLETMSEGDVYPRPRYNVPSAYLEGFDTALLADGRLNGILKYGVDYTSSPFYENGYALKAESNKPLYSSIEKCFSNKESVGVSVACTMKKVRNRTFSNEVSSAHKYCEYNFMQPEQAFLCDNSIPVKYDNHGVCTCFGENAKYINPDTFDGMILDIPAAVILKDRGIDTGLIEVAPSEHDIIFEIFPEENEKTVLGGNNNLYLVETKETAKVLSFFEYSKNYPSSFTYENEQGQRFYVLCADMSNSRNVSGFRRNYCRQKQLISTIEWLGKEPLPAVCPKNPDLYIMCKKSEDGLSVGLWNFFEDGITNPVVTLDKAYSSAKFINCTGRMEDNTVYLQGELGPYSFMGFEVL